MSIATNKHNDSQKATSLTNRGVKAPYQKPSLTEMGTLASFVQDVLPGSAGDVLGTGFDPDPFS